jgi:hypothetical protein
MCTFLNGQQYGALMLNNKLHIFSGGTGWGSLQPLVPLLLLRPSFFPIILFLPYTLLTGTTSSSLYKEMASDFSVACQFSQREQLFFHYGSNSMSNTFFIIADHSSEFQLTNPKTFDHLSEGYIIEAPEGIGSFPDLS